MRRRILLVLGPVVLMTVTTACNPVEANREPWCDAVPATVLIAQSVPSASLVPCVRAMPAGWMFESFTASDAGATFALAGPDDTPARTDVSFSEACPGASGSPVRSDEPDTELLEDVRRQEPFSAVWSYRFDGGCTRISLTLGRGSDAARATQDLARALSFIGREAVLPAA